MLEILQRLQGEVQTVLDLLTQAITAELDRQNNPPPPPPPPPPGPEDRLGELAAQALWIAISNYRDGTGPVVAENGLVHWSQAALGLPDMTLGYITDPPMTQPDVQQIAPLDMVLDVGRTVLAALINKTAGATVVEPAMVFYDHGSSMKGRVTVPFAPPSS